MFDFLPHDVLLPKLDAYEFSNSSLNLISSFLSNKKYFKKIILPKVVRKLAPLRGVPQASVLRLLLFNIYVLSCLVCHRL